MDKLRSGKTKDLEIAFWFKTSTYGNDFFVVNCKSRLKDFLLDGIFNPIKYSSHKLYSIFIYYLRKVHEKIYRIK